MLRGERLKVAVTAHQVMMKSKSCFLIVPQNVEFHHQSLLARFMLFHHHSYFVKDEEAEDLHQDFNQSLGLLSILTKCSRLVFFLVTMDSFYFLMLAICFISSHAFSTKICCALVFTVVALRVPFFKNCF